MDTIEWQRWPLREQGREGWVKGGAALVIAGLAAMLAFISLPPVAAGLLIFLLLVTLLPYFLPRNYRASAEAVVTMRSFLADRREWREFRSYRQVEQGYVLQPVADKPARFSLFLPKPLENAKAEFLEKMLQEKFPVQQA